MKRINRSGMRYGRLVVLSYAGNCYWNCLCDCGKNVLVLGGNLDKGDIKSCGCLHSETAGNLKRKHDGNHTRLYEIWKAMKQRCCNPSNENYHHYGGRGITVCTEWRTDFSAFRTWAFANGYSESLSIDRINPNGNYSPDNCRWATAIEQGRNKRDTIYVEVGGVSRPLVEWCEMYGTPYATALHRLKVQHLSGIEIFI